MAMYPSGYVSIAVVRESGRPPSPAGAMSVSWYSTDSRSRTSSETVGLVARRNASVLPAQSWPRSQMTGSRGAVATAAAMRGA